jgi:hypothetical protein
MSTSRAVEEHTTPANEKRKCTMEKRKGRRPPWPRCSALRFFRAGTASRQAPAAGTAVASAGGGEHEPSVDVDIGRAAADDHDRTGTVHEDGRGIASALPSTSASSCPRARAPTSYAPHDQSLYTFPLNIRVPPSLFSRALLPSPREYHR